MSLWRLRNVPEKPIHRLVHLVGSGVRSREHPESRIMLRRVSVLLPLFVLSLIVSITILGPSFAQAAKGKKYALLVGVTDTKRRTQPAAIYRERCRGTRQDPGGQGQRFRQGDGAEPHARQEEHERPADRSQHPHCHRRLVREKGRNDTILIGLAGHGVQLEVKDPDERASRRLPLLLPQRCRLARGELQHGQVQASFCWTNYSPRWAGAARPTAW